MTSRTPVQRASSRRPTPAASSSARWVISAGRPPSYAAGSAGCHSSFRTTTGSATVVSGAGISAQGWLPGWSEARAVSSSGPAPSPPVTSRRPRSSVSAMSASAPRQDSLPPGIGQAEQEDADEDQHAHEHEAGADVRPRVAEDQRPQVDEDDLDVEGHEQQGVDVERQTEPAVRVAIGVDPGFVRQALVDVAARPMRDEPREAEGHEGERPGRDGEPDDVPDPGQAILASSAPCSGSLDLDIPSRVGTLETFATSRSEAVVARIHSTGSDRPTGLARQ